MNSYNTKFTLNVGLIIALSSLSGLVAFDVAKAQTNHSNYQLSDIPLNDQARYLRGLTIQDSFQWNFATAKDRLIDNNTYKLSISEPDIRIIEQDIPEWRNTGEDADYSVLVDVYEFTEEENTP